jgi:putative FmdB family regulatory protein
VPLYEYECREHGVFDLVRSLSDWKSRGRCPRCENEAERILSAPAVSRMARSDVIAHDRNERSRHEPRVAERPAEPSPRAPPPAAPLLCSYNGPRPWAIEH